MSREQYVTPMARLHDESKRSFASDNYSGVHPKLLAAITAANGGHVPSYGSDPYTERLREVAIETFGVGAEIFPTLTGTGSNIVALHAVLGRHQSAIAASSAHVAVDEGGAPERAGIKLLLVDTPDGKLTPELIDQQAWGWGDQHRSQPGAVTITQPTELGTLYTLQEIRAISDHVHAHGMALHMDGARIANAAVALEVSLKEMTTDVGVDILSFGATKNGGLIAEAVVVINSELALAIPYLRKGSAQLGSKLRFISAQLLALLDDELWRKCAENSNRTALRLAHSLSGLAGLTIAHPVQANAVFAILPREITERLLKKYNFYVWNESTGMVRWMTSWDTTNEDVDAFVQAIKQELLI